MRLYGLDTLDGDHAPANTTSVPRRRTSADTDVRHRIGLDRDLGLVDAVAHEQPLRKGRQGEPAVDTPRLCPDGAMQPETDGQGGGSGHAVVIAAMPDPGQLEARADTVFARVPVTYTGTRDARPSKLCSVVTVGTPRWCAARKTAGDINGKGVCTCTTSGRDDAIVSLTFVAISLFQIAFRAWRPELSPSWSAAASVSSSTSWPASRSNSPSWTMTSVAPPRPRGWLCSCKIRTSAVHLRPTARSASPVAR